MVEITVQRLPIAQERANWDSATWRCRRNGHGVDFDERAWRFFGKGWETFKVVAGANGLPEGWWAYRVNFVHRLGLCLKQNAFSWLTATWGGSYNSDRHSEHPLKTRSSEENTVPEEHRVKGYAQYSWHVAWFWFLNWWDRGGYIHLREKWLGMTWTTLPVCNLAGILCDRTGCPSSPESSFCSDQRCGVEIMVFNPGKGMSGSADIGKSYRPSF